MLVTAAGITAFLGKALYDAKLQKKDQQNMIKSDEELIGEQFYMPRIGKGSLDYESALKEYGVSTEVKTYDGAMHGFIEENNPEYGKLHSHPSMSEEQEIMARDAEAVIGTWISEHSIRSLVN